MKRSSSLHLEDLHAATPSLFCGRIPSNQDRVNVDISQVPEMAGAGDCMMNFDAQDRAEHASYCLSQWVSRM
jgi:hypothetical protein